MGTRDRWLDEGLDLLRTGGVGALRTDRLAARLGLTKGSFHHHFAGMPDYRRALLERCRAINTKLMTAVRAGVAGLAPTEAIASLGGPASTILDVALDAALRGWAVEDALARDTMEAIDSERLELLTDLWARVLVDRTAARTAALVPHLIAVGASVSSDVSRDDMLRVYELLARLVPTAAGQ